MIEERMLYTNMKGLSWLEPAREFVLSLNQAAKLLESENKTEMTTFLKNIGSNCILQNRQLIFLPKIQYELAAEPRTRTSSVRDKLREAVSSGLPFSKVSPH